MSLVTQMPAVTKQLDTLFATAQQLASALKDDPNPHRTAYVRLIGDLEAILLNAYSRTDATTRLYIDQHLAGRVGAWQAMVAKMNEV